MIISVMFRLISTDTSQLYNLISQRDSRTQSEIARAAQKDSQDMKFIALLGSVFLPAGLVAVSRSSPSVSVLLVFC